VNLPASAEDYKKPIFAREPWRIPMLQPGFITGWVLDRQPELQDEIIEPKIASVLAHSMDTRPHAVKLAWAILEQAFSDVRRVGSASNEKRARVFREQAMSWFRGADDGGVTLDAVCGVLGLDADCVERAARASKVGADRRWLRLVDDAPEPRAVMDRCGMCGFATSKGGAMVNHMRRHTVPFNREEAATLPAHHARALLNDPRAFDE
jgi:hypothetical protein